jgi:excisionase family DNA binding protein
MSFQPATRRAQQIESDWLTLGQAARFLGVAQSTIRKWSDDGKVAAFYTPGGHRRFRRADLEAFIADSGPAGRRVPD